MSSAPDAASDFAPRLTIIGRRDVPWCVVSVTPLDGFRLRVRFIDGLEGEVQLAELLNSARPGVFEPLRDPAEFRRVGLSTYGVVTWPGELDLAPDAMYDDIKATGVCIVRPYRG
jgi:hypothetical protein